MAFAANFAYDILKLGFFALRDRVIGPDQHRALREAYRDATAALLIASHQHLLSQPELAVQEEFLRKLAAGNESLRLVASLALTPDDSLPALRDHCLRRRRRDKAMAEPGNARPKMPVSSRFSWVPGVV